MSLNAGAGSPSVTYSTYPLKVAGMSFAWLWAQGEHAISTQTSHQLAALNPELSCRESTANHCTNVPPWLGSKGSKIGNDLWVGGMANSLILVHYRGSSQSYKSSLTMGQWWLSD